MCITHMVYRCCLNPSSHQTNHLGRFPTTGMFMTCKADGGTKSTSRAQLILLFLRFCVICDQRQ